MRLLKLVNRKAKAFTIMELMVAMVLFITIISLGMLVWNNVSNGIRRIQNESDIFYDYISFITLLEKDVNQAVTIDNKGIRLDFTNDINDISYTFYPDSVVRSVDGNNYKFNIKTLSYKFSYIKGLDVVNGVDLHFKLQGKDIGCFINRSIEGKPLIKTLLENGN